MPGASAVNGRPARPGGYVLHLQMVYSFFPSAKLLTKSVAGIRTAPAADMTDPFQRTWEAASLRNPAASGFPRLYLPARAKIASWSTN